MRLPQQVQDALKTLRSGGEKLDRYFGITPGSVPVEPPAEAARSNALINELKDSVETGDDLTGLFGRISAHANSSGADAGAIRALMKQSRNVRRSRAA